jgi:hypothetical protein
MTFTHLLRCDAETGTACLGIGPSYETASTSGAGAGVAVGSV